jgi:CBS-domain-containing membrane protein
MMNTLFHRLSTLRVADVMNREVVSVPNSLSMDEAAQRLAAHDVTSAPVVDDQGRCVGMLSAADFLRRDCRGHESTAGGALSGSEHGVARLAFEPLTIERVDDCNVHRHMSSAVQSIRAGAAVIDAGRMMCNAHLHRLPVLDDTGRPIGIVSSLDLVSAMMNAMDEQRLAERTNQ